jgi:polar amino acid transport system permease protein
VTTVVDSDLAPDAEVDVATARHRRRPLRWLGGAVLVVLAAQVAWFLTHNDQLEWPVVADYLFDPNVLAGLGMSVLLTVVAMTAGSVLGVLLAMGQLADFAPVRWVCTFYVGLFRGIPPLVQLLFWFNLAYLLPKLSIGIPFGPEFGSWPTNDVITPLTAALVGLTLHESAYMAEIVRAGILSVDTGQRDAAMAMGFTGGQTFFRVVLPQAMRVIIPPSGSQFISLLMGTSLVSVIAMTDLLHAVQQVYNQTYQIVPMLIVACFWYLVVVTALSFGQQRLERRFGRGTSQVRRPA